LPISASTWDAVDVPGTRPRPSYDAHPASTAASKVTEDNKDNKDMEDKDIEDSSFGFAIMAGMLPLAPEPAQG
jgi:hypothetical protein